MLGIAGIWCITDCHLGKDRWNTLGKLLSTSVLVIVWMDCFGTQHGSSKVGLTVILHFAMQYSPVTCIIHQYLIMMIFNRMAYASLWKIKFQTTRVSCELSGNLQQTAKISRKETALKSKQHPTGAYKSRQYEMCVKSTCKLSSMRFSSLREINSVYDYHEGKDETLWSTDERAEKIGQKYKRWHLLAER